MIIEAMKEIVSTEKSYVNDLNQLVATFVQPLRDAAMGPKPVLSSDKILIIFGNIDILLCLNTKLLDDLSKELQGEGRIGKVILEFAPFLKIYSTYVDAYDAAIHTMGKYDRFIFFKCRWLMFDTVTLNILRKDKKHKLLFIL